MRNSEAREKLLEEYKLCRATTEGLDRNIWQAATIFVIGSAAGLITVLKELPMSNSYYTFGSFILGLLVIGMLWTWYRLALRWDSIKYAMILRMENIEKETTLRANHYARYLDNFKQMEKEKDEEKKKTLKDELLELEKLIGKESSQMLEKRGKSYEYKSIRAMLFFAVVISSASWLILVIIPSFLEFSHISFFQIQQLPFLMPTLGIICLLFFFIFWLCQWNKP